VIDLTPPLGFGGNIISYEHVIVDGVPGFQKPHKVKIAIPFWGVPFTSYNYGSLNFIQYNKETPELCELILLSVEKAAERGAKAIVFPEFFVPRRAKDQIVSKSNEVNIIFIGGLEGRTTLDGKIVNEAMIHVPAQAEPVYQLKQKPSIEEPNIPRFFSDGKFYLFRDTEIGHFAVVLCSDYREFDIINHIATCSVLLDVLFVCSFNHAIELYDHMALADASRLHCYVVLVNNYSDHKDNRTGPFGTMIASPMREASDAKRIPQTTELVDIGVDEFAGQKPLLWITSLNLEALMHRNRERAVEGYNPPPHCRR
jgi:predicted amidohydrolase